MTSTSSEGGSIGMMFLTRWVNAAPPVFERACLAVASKTMR